MKNGRWVWSLSGVLNDGISGQSVFKELSNLTSLLCFQTFFSAKSRSIIILFFSKMFFVCYLFLSFSVNEVISA